MIKIQAKETEKPPKISKLTIVLLILWVLVLSLIVLEYANPQLYPPGRDGGAYMYGGRTVLHGKTLYVDYWEAKGPLIMFINAFGLLIGGDSRWGIWLVEVLVWVLSAFLGYLTLKTQYGLLSALMGVMVMMMAGKHLVGAGNFTEEYTLLFTWISIFSFFQLIRKPASRVFPIVMGAMLALNFFIRANNVVTGGLLILIWLYYARRTKQFKGMLRDAALFLIGGLIITLPITTYFLIQGTLVDMLNASLVYNFSYSFGTRPGVSNLNIIQSSFLPAFSALGAWMAFPLVGFVIALIMLIKNVFARHLDPVNLVLVVIWPLEMLASSISGRSYGHYFLLWLPGMALLSTYGFDFALKQIWIHFTIKSLPNWISSLVLPITLILSSIFFYQQLAQYGDSLAQVIFHRDETAEYIHPISAFIAENSDPDDLVLVWGGQTGMLLMSNRHSSTAYNFYPLYANSRIGREIQRQYFEDLQHNRPKLILDAHIHAPDSLPSIDLGIRASQRLIYPIAENHIEVLDYINANYSLIHNQDGYQVYQILDSFDH